MNQCQSCGLPLDDKTISKLDKRYCLYCQNQKTGELKTKEQVREKSIQAAIRLLRKSREESEKIADEILVKLPRWQENKN